MRSLLFIPICILTLNAGAIVGGTEYDASSAGADAKLMASHTVVVLNTQSNSHVRCTGTLISKNVVLTAAHCIPASINNLWIVTSEYEFSVSDEHPVTKAVPHPSFDPTAVETFDLALVKFSGDLPTNYAPTTWVTSFTTAQTRLWFPIAGYGETASGADDQGILHIGQVTAFNFDTTSAGFEVDQSMGQGICLGDSGAAAFLKIGSEFYVYGIANAVSGITPSGVSTQDQCQGVSFFTSAMHYQNWIATTLQSLL